MKVLCKILSLSFKIYTNSATLKQDTISLEKSACLVDNNVGTKKKKPT